MPWVGAAEELAAAWGCTRAALHCNPRKPQNMVRLVREWDVLHVLHRKDSSTTPDCTTP